MLRTDDFVKGQLVLYGWRAGRAWGGHTASCLILSVLANRHKRGWGAYMDLLADAPNKAGSDFDDTAIPNLWDPNFVRLLHEVESIFDGSMDHAKGALYYCDSTKIDNPWFKQFILDKPDEHARIGGMDTLMLFA
jgi:hypothetical protein